MKNDMISRQTAIDYINRALPNWSEDKETAIDCLDNIPAVDAVPVVRCKDCRRWGHPIIGNEHRRFCRCYGSAMLPDDFCSRGKRMEDGND